MNQMQFRDAIEACSSAAAACQHCATECLKEDDVKMMSLCISLTRECALICATTAQLLAMNGEHAMALCHVCIGVCGSCAQECERYAESKHCRHCAEECRRCAELVESIIAHA